MAEAAAEVEEEGFGGGGGGGSGSAVDGRWSFEEGNDAGEGRIVGERELEEAPVADAGVGMDAPGSFALLGVRWVR